MFSRRRMRHAQRRTPALLVSHSAFLFFTWVYAASFAAQTVSQLPSFSTESTELVVVPVTVLDDRGRLIADLPRERFTVFDNGRPQTIAFFSNEDTPVTVGLILDDSRSMGPKLGQVIAAALTFARSSNPQDELFALAFNDAVQDPLPGKFLITSDLPAIESALSALRPDGRTSLYDALVAGLDRLADASRPRKILIVVSDGGDNASRATLDQVLARARRSNVTIYTIGLFDTNEVDTNPKVLKALARTTGGERFLPESPGRLIQDCQHIAREIRSGYTIGYVPPDHDGAFHRVRVEIQPADRRLTLRTRPGYFAAARMGER
jgi:Ca-activated chloride channel homolog